MCTYWPSPELCIRSMDFISSFFAHDSNCAGAYLAAVNFARRCDSKLINNIETLHDASAFLNFSIFFVHSTQEEYYSNRLFLTMSSVLTASVVNAFISSLFVAVGFNFAVLNALMVRSLL